MEDKQKKCYIKPMIVKEARLDKPGDNHCHQVKDNACSPYQLKA